MLEWLISTTLETSLLISLVLLIRPFVLRLLGAHACYSLWLIPVLGAMLPTRPHRPAMSLELLPRVIANGSRDVYTSAHSAAEGFMSPVGGSWVSIWILGMAVWVTVRLLGNQRFANALRCNATPAGDLPRRIQDRLRESDLTCDAVLLTTCRYAPFVSGLMRPRIYLPSDFARRFSTKELAWVMEHEVAHIRRGDLWIRAFAEVFRVVFWFNPLVHLAVAAFRRDQEYACDSTVIGSCTPQQRCDYGNALLLGAKGRSTNALAAFFGNSKERYIMLGRHKNSTRQFIIGTAVCALVGAASLTSPPALLAQGSAGSAYDLESLVTVQGAVVKVTRQVRSHELTVSISGSDPDGTAQHWEVKFGDRLSELVADSERPNPFQMGEELVVRGHPSIDSGSRVILATSELRAGGSEAE